MHRMSEPVSRRAALQLIGAAGAGAVLSGRFVRGQSRPILVAGKAVEIVVASISPSTVRITVLPLDRAAANALDDGALVPAAEGRALGRRRAPDSFAPIRAGNLVVRFTSEPPTIHVDGPDGAAVQRMTLAPQAARCFVPARNGTAARPRGGRAAVRSQGHRGSRAQRPGRLPVAHARRPRADPVADRHRGMGDVHPSSARARST